MPLYKDLYFKKGILTKAAFCKQAHVWQRRTEVYAGKGTNLLTEEGKRVKKIWFI